eukprot:c23541_g1_i2 orf=379-1017(+)
MGSEAVVFNGVSFANAISSPSSSKILMLLGTGIVDMEIHFIEVIFYAIGLYMDPEIASHLQSWKGTPVSELLGEDSGFFESLCKAPGEKLLKVVIFKELKGSQHISAIKSSACDRLVEKDQFEEEEEESLEKLLAYFQTKTWLKKDTVICYHWVSSALLQISVSEDGALPSKAEHTVENQNVVSGILDVFVGQSSMSPTLLASMAEGIGKFL